MHSTILHNVSPDEITGQFKELQKQLNELKQNLQPKTPAEYLTRTEVATLLKCNLSTIHNWCKNGKLKPYALGNRIYFLRSQIEETLTPLNINQK